MTLSVLHQTLSRIREHILLHSWSRPHLILHGGEPLLIGKERFKRYLEEIESALKGYDFSVSIQTNGLLIDDEWLQLFSDHSVHVGISFDGTPDAHDRYRVTRKGKETSQKTIAVIRLLQEQAGDLFGGVLCVIDPFSSGAQAVRYLIKLGIKSFDFLLPDANWQKPPRAPISAFLIDAFDAWFDHDDPTVRVRLFREIIRSLFGAESTLDIFGNIWGSTVSIDTDGELSVNDVLQICGSHSSYNVAIHRIDDLMNIKNFPWIRRPDQCSKCEIQEVCRVGHPAHRFDGTDFSKPTVYCADTRDFVGHIARRMHERLMVQDGNRYARLTRALDLPSGPGAKAVPHPQSLVQLPT